MSNEGMNTLNRHKRTHSRLLKPPEFAALLNTDGYVHGSEVVAQDATRIVAAELLNALDGSEVSEMIN
jgi:hypothetical protein